MIENDGDIIKGLGFVTMHSAHLEGRIDDLLFQLSVIENLINEKQKWPISRKIKMAKSILTKLNHPIAKDLLVVLEVCSGNFEWRNELVHGRIYSPAYHIENLKSGRPNVPDRRATSEELYRLANNLRNLCSEVYGYMFSELPEALKEYLEKRT